MGLDSPDTLYFHFADLARALPYYEQSRVTQAEHAERIAARQAAVAARMLG